MSVYENVIAYDGVYEDGVFVPLDEMPPHKGRHRAMLLLLSEPARTREHSMWKAYQGDESPNSENSVSYIRSLPRQLKKL